MFTINAPLRYRTGTASFIQLAVVVLLVVLNNIVALFQACTSGSDCAVTAMFSLIFIIMAGVWFFVISAIGYAAEERRSRKLAFVLIAAQIATAGIAWGFLKHPGNWFGALSAFLVMLSAGWICLLAWRLAQARGGRVVARPQRPDTPPRVRRRLHSTNHTDAIDSDQK